MISRDNLGPWVEEVTNDALTLLFNRGKIPGFFTKGADGQGIDFKTGMDFLIGLWNGLSMKLQVKYSEGKSPFRSLGRHLKHYPSVRYILLFSNRLEDDLVKWEREQKAPDVRDRFGRDTPEGIHIALVHTDPEIHALAARERATLTRHRRYRTLCDEISYYRRCRGRVSRQLPRDLWRRLANVEDEIRAIVEEGRAPFRADPRYRAFVERVASALERFVEAACITALNYEKEAEIRRKKAETDVSENEGK